VKIAMLKLRHEWGKVYEYLSEFNRLSRIMQLLEKTKHLLLVQQVKPSVREAFYDLADEKQNPRRLRSMFKKMLHIPRGLQE